MDEPTFIYRAELAQKALHTVPSYHNHDLINCGKTV